MDNRKRRSSLRKAEDAGENTIRLKRRISFSGKKLIREFSKETEPQTWNHSYEVSDKQDNSDNIANTVCNDGTLIKTNEITTLQLPNENAGIHRNAKSKPNAYNPNRENSFDITLFEHESNGCKQNLASTAAYTYDQPEASFSLVEHEKDALLKTRKSLIDFESTVDYLRDLSATGNNGKSNSRKNTRRTVIYDEAIQTCSELDFEEKTRENKISLYSEINKENMTPSKIPRPQKFTQDRNVMSLKQPVEPDLINKLSADFERKLQNLSFNMENDESCNSNDHETKENSTSEVSTAKQSNKTIILNEDIKSVELSISEANNFQNETINNDMDLTVTNCFKEMQTKDLAEFGADDCSVKNILCESTYQSSICLCSPVTSSPLVPPELVTYSNRKLNCRQIMDDIEQGRLQVYKDAQRTPLTGLNKIRSQFAHLNAENQSRMSKVRATLYFDDEIVPVEENTSTLTKLDINDIDLLKLSKKNHRDIRFSQAGEILLNNTNFLTHAKLGDETASCNSSKNSILSKRETVYLDEEIPCETTEILEDVKCESEKEEERKEKVENIPCIENVDGFDIVDDHHERSVQQIEEDSQCNAHKDNKISTRIGNESVVLKNWDTNISSNEILGSPKIKETTNDKQEDVGCNDSENDVFSYILDEHLDVKTVEKSSSRRVCAEGNVQSGASIEQCDKKSDEWNVSKNLFKKPNIILNDRKKQTETDGNIEREEFNMKQSSFTSENLNNEPMDVDQTHCTFTEKNELIDHITATSTNLCKSLLKKVSTGNFVQSAPITPRRPIKSNLYNGTPHRSLIEFEHLEKECDGIMVSDDCSVISFHEKNEKPERVDHRKTNVEPLRIECERSEETPTNRNRKIHRLTNIVSCNMEFDNSMNDIDSNEENQSINAKSKNSILPTETISNSMQFGNRADSKDYANFTLIQNSTILEDKNFEETFEDNKKNLSNNTIVDNTTSMKRLSINLTPLIINSKKRQTILYRDCDLELDLDSKTNLDYIPVSSTTRKTQLFSDDGHYISTDECPETENDVTKQNYENDINISTCVQEKQKLNSINLSVDCDFDTIQIPRHQTMRNLQHNNSFSNALPTPVKKMDDSLGEKDAITISDVSVFYQSRQAKILADTSEYLREKNENNISDRRSSDTELQNVACFKKKFINCTSDSMFLSVGDVNWDDIDKTRLSLVETLSDEEVELNNDGKSDSKDSHYSFKTNEHASTKHKRLSNCRKCRRCQETLSNETTNIDVVDSFHIPNMLEIPKLNLDRLKRLRQLPSLKESREYWARIEAERALSREQQAIPCAVATDGNDGITVDFRNFKSATSIIGEYKADIKEAERAIRNFPIGNIEQRSSVVLRLQRFLKIENLHNWIFDFQMQNRNTFVFTHKKIATINFLLPFEQVDELGERVLVKAITMTPSRFKKKYWSLLHSIIDFQLKVDFSLIPPTISQIKNENGVFDMLKKLGTLCEAVHTGAFALFRLVCKERATLKRYENIIYVQKIVYNSGNYCNQLSSVEKCEFLVEIKNINNVSFRDIRKPHLYEFKNEIELLPSGLEFLSLFLKDPCRFLK